MSVKNIEMNDVVSTFAKVDASNYSKHEFHCSSHLIDRSNIIKSHFKGIAFFDDMWIFTYTNLGVVCDGKGKYLVTDGPGGEERVECQVYDTDHPEWSHPCGTQACGIYMAMGIQKNADPESPGGSQIRIYERIHSPEAMKLIATIIRTNNVNGVAMTKEKGPNGRYIVAGMEDELIVYLSKSSDTPTEFDAGVTLTPLTPPEKGALGTGLALVTQMNGDIYLISMYANDDGTDNKTRLHKLDLSSSPPSYTFVKETTLPIHEEKPLSLVGGSCFRWGKGVAITSPYDIRLYASSRNLNMIDSTFNVIVWTNKG
jgi:hypothetical protein